MLTGSFRKARTASSGMYKSSHPHHPPQKVLAVISQLTRKGNGPRMELAEQRENYPGCLMTTEQLCHTSTEVLQPGYVQLCKPVNLLLKSLQPILVVVTCN